MATAPPRGGEFRKVSQNRVRYTANERYYAVFKIGGKKIWRNCRVVFKVGKFCNYFGVRVEGLGEYFEPQLHAGTSADSVKGTLPPAVAGLQPGVVLR